MTYAEYVTSVLNSYKRKNAESNLILVPILNGEKSTIGYLRPITVDFRETLPECAELFGNWRKNNPTFSPSRFVITKESTERWLIDCIVYNDQRILFAIQTLSGENVGHIGFANFRYHTKTAEVDCVLRGVKNKFPGLMEHAMGSLIRWGKQELQLGHIDLRVLWDNDHAIAFYQRCGFQKGELIALKRIETNGEIQWHPYEEMVPTAEKFYLHMTLF